MPEYTLELKKTIVVEIASPTLEQAVADSQDKEFDGAWAVAEVAARTLLVNEQPEVHTRRLFKMIEAAPQSVVDGYEIDSTDFDKPGLCTLSCDEDNHWTFNDQPVSFHEGDQAFTVVTEDGDEVVIEFYDIQPFNVLEAKV